jgi:hypothetical protein
MWAAPNDFFTDGPVVNLGADFGLMPSKFEPGGIVQHEFFVGGTPVVAFKTGGLKDTVFEYKWDTNEGNGFNFEVYNRGDFIYAIERAIGTYYNKEKYRLLRENARRATMDGATVTREWLKEFCRLRDKMFIDYELQVQELAKIPADWDFSKFNDAYVDEYIYNTYITAKEQFSEEQKQAYFTQLSKKAAKDHVAAVSFKLNLDTKYAHRVQLCGSFDAWKIVHNMNYDTYTNSWFLTLHLKKGKYLYANL